MNAYERIIKLMREQVAEMTSATSCKVGDLKLDADDLLIAEHITDYEIKISPQSGGDTRVIKVHSVLKKGDVVLVYRLSDEQYVIIEKLVEV